MPCTFLGYFHIPHPRGRGTRLPSRCAARRELLPLDDHRLPVRVFPVQVHLLDCGEVTTHDSVSEILSLASKSVPVQLNPFLCLPFSSSLIPSKYSRGTGGDQGAPRPMAYVHACTCMYDIKLSIDTYLVPSHYRNCSKSSSVRGL